MQISSYNLKSTNYISKTKHTSGISFKKTIVNIDSIKKCVPESEEFMQKSMKTLNKLGEKVNILIEGRKGCLRFIVFGKNSKLQDEFIIKNDVAGLKRLTSNFSKRNIIKTAKEAIAEYMSNINK